MRTGLIRALDSLQEEEAMKLQIKINASLNTPIYRQIVEQIRSLILKGELKPDCQLPSVRTLAMDARVNPLTVQRAFAELKSDNLIYNRRGEGTFVNQTSKKEESTMKIDDLKKAIQQVLNQAQLYRLDLNEINQIWNVEYKKVKGDENVS